MTSDAIRVLIVDDHPVVRTGLRGMLVAEPDVDVIGEATNGLEAVTLAERLRPDVVLMDLRLPELDGVGATARLTAELPDIRVVILTTYDRDADILRAIEAGAIGYLLKDAARQDLFRAIRAAKAGEPLLAPTVTAKLMEQLRQPPADTLSAREVEVLRHVARGASNRDIGQQLFVSEATIKTHLIHIYQKLGVSDRTAAVMTALERGLLELYDQRDRG